MVYRFGNQGWSGWYIPKRSISAPPVTPTFGKPGSGTVNIPRYMVPIPSGYFFPNPGRGYVKNLTLEDVLSSGTYPLFFRFLSKKAILMNTSNLGVGSDDVPHWCSWDRFCKSDPPVYLGIVLLHNSSGDVQWSFVTFHCNFIPVILVLSSPK
jgi:hypothetical protein